MSSRFLVLILLCASPVAFSAPVSGAAPENLDKIIYSDRQIDSLNKKADALFKLKKYPQQARRLYQKVLKATEARYGIDHPMLIPPLNNIVRVSCIGNQCFETIPELKRMLAIRQKAFGKDSRDVPINLLLIGEAYEKEHRYTEAIDYFQQAVDSEKRKDGSNSALAQSLAKNITRVERERKLEARQRPTKGIAK